MKQQWRGNVIGKIADDFQRAASLFAVAEIELQGIGLVDQQLAVTGGFFAQQRHQVAIEFHGLQRAMFLQQGQGDRAPTRADLDDGVARSRVDRADDALDDSRVVEKMLAETFAGMVSHGSVSLIFRSSPHQLDRQADRRLQTSAVGFTGAGQVQCGAMVYRGSDQRQPEGDVDGVAEAGVF